MEAAQVPWRPLGELFVSRGLITEAELETALAEQAATGRRLGEILVERNLVSGPDLTGALMDQLGVEISKEEGFGSGLWAEIKRRHKRAQPDGSEETDETEEHEGHPGLALVEDQPVAIEPDPEWEGPVPEAVAPEAEPAAFELEPAAFDAMPEPFAHDDEAAPFGADVDGEPFAPAIDPELERELEELRTEYEPPTPIEAQPELELVHEPAAESAGDVDVEHDETAMLRAELEQARADLKHLQDMLADSMTALAALTGQNGA